MTPNKNSRAPVKRKSNKTLFLVIGIIAIIIIGIAAYAILGQGNQPANTNPTATPTPSPTTSPTSDPEYTNATEVLLQTTAGNITLELRSDKPITTGNFINLVNRGVYDGTTFYRVIAGFMIQGGENDSANVATIPDEIGNDNLNLPYTIAMAKTSQPNSATSQFFINVGDNSKMTYQDGSTFDGTYTVFGRVISGQNVVDTIANASVTTNSYGENSQPINPVAVIKATVIT
ncbi:MAG: peptidylprolyl isomerase [Chloroflexi bacterium]|nr:peptidylprolyl isomerase [Chloroflexota bacterium]